MRVRLAYGQSGLDVDLPAERTTVVAPQYRPAAADPRAEVVRALREPIAGPPLRERVGPGQRVAISICDGTRPQPRDVMVPAVLDELAGTIDPADIVVLVATGTHRGNTDAELQAMLGADVLGRVRVVNHDARDQKRLTWLGNFGANVPVWLNSEWVAADIRITTGFVEPHFFAGFSGGPKMVAPGLAGLDTVLTLHNAARIGDPRATWGVIEGNPVHDDVRAIAAGTGVDYSVDVVLNRDQAIVAAFGGDLFAMHQAACALAREVAMRPVKAPYDIVVTTNSGFPLDQNLYQSVKGMSAAAQVVRPGGTIVCAAECRDGFPDHGEYRAELTRYESPAALLAAIGARVETVPTGSAPRAPLRTVPDQWQIQIQARIQAHARVVMHTTMPDADLAAAHLEQTADIGALVAATPGSVCVLPEGPQTIPYVDEHLK